MANVALGCTLPNLTTGDDNVCLGDQCGDSLTTGLSNTFVGDTAGKCNTGGYDNTFLGAHSGYYTSTGYNLTGCGAGALYFNTTGQNNTAHGVNALRVNTTGFSNSALGYVSLYNNQTGYQNSAFGQAALRNNTSGSNNAAFGMESLYNNQTGNNNTAVGTLALSAVTSSSNCTGIGYQAEVTGSNQVQLGNSSTTTYAYGAVQNRSDARDKTEIRDTTLGLDFINQLRPVDFKWDYREDYGWQEKDGSKKRTRFHHGLIAQEVLALGVDFGGLQHHEANGGKDVYSIGYEELIAPMIKAIQELNEKIDNKR